MVLISIPFSFSPCRVLEVHFDCDWLAAQPFLLADGLEMRLEVQMLLEMETMHSS